MNNKQLIQEARKAREKAYAPYSHFTVGAALLTKSGKIYHGCNIENAAYTPTNCAERTAFFKAVSDGEREFQRIAIVGGREGEKENPVCAPCGVCRQVMMEFCGGECFGVVLSEEKEVLLKDLVPYGFGMEDLK